MRNREDRTIGFFLLLVTALSVGGFGRRAEAAVAPGAATSASASTDAALEPESPARAEPAGPAEPLGAAGPSASAPEEAGAPGEAAAVAEPPVSPEHTPRAPAAAPIRQRLPEPKSAAPVPAPPPARAPAIVYYEPIEVDQADAALPWNTSVLGPFDPWTRAKVAVLGQFEGLSTSFADTEKLAGPVLGARLEWGSLGVGYGIGRLTRSSSDPAVPLNAPVDVSSITVSKDFGAWAFMDLDGPDIRVGIAWPEVFVRYISARSPSGGSASGPEVVGLTETVFGAAVPGVRATFGDFVYVEARVGEGYFGNVYTKVARDGETRSATKDLFGFAFVPTVRVGLAL